MIITIILSFVVFLCYVGNGAYVAGYIEGLAESDPPPGFVLFLMGTFWPVILVVGLVFFLGGTLFDIGKQDGRV